MPEYRNARGWRDLGYRVMFREGRVYVFAVRATGPEASCWTTPIAGGEWMRSTTLNAAPWRRTDFGALVPALSRDLRSTDAACYCSSLPGGCDFCQGVRKAAA